MCKCRVLEAANVDAYLFDNMMQEEWAMQDVVKATTMDFGYTVDRLKRSPDNQHLLRHAYELMQFMQCDDSFQFMDMDSDTYIEMMLEGAGLTVQDVLEKVFHCQAGIRSNNGVKNAKPAPALAGILPERNRKPSYNIHGCCHGRG